MMPQASESVLFSQCHSTGTEPGLGDQWQSGMFSKKRHTHLQPSAAKNKWWQDFVSEGSREQLLSPTTRLGLGSGIFYHQHSMENFGEGGEGWRHERFAVSHPNTTHSPTGIHLERTWSPEPGYFTDGNSGPKPLSHWSLKETPSSSKTC